MAFELMNSPINLPAEVVMTPRAAIRALKVPADCTTAA